ncbi:hypothetical protein GCM10023235_14720 [Kitasatospora terrestris]|uniref:Uncharacterized protein n=1 Tax=Kitasatospora terrestris TaxID=258051 RepID=A0ABP9DHF7_9ACTN
MVGVEGAVDEALLDEPVDPVGEGGGADHGGAAEGAGAEDVGRAGSQEGGEDVELPGFDALSTEGVLHAPFEETGRPGEPADDGHGGDVEVGSDGVPLLDDRVDSVALQVKVAHDLQSNISTSKYLTLATGSAYSFDIEMFDPRFTWGLL